MFKPIKNNIYNNFFKTILSNVFKGLTRLACNLYTVGLEKFFQNSYFNRTFWPNSMKSGMVCINELGSPFLQLYVHGLLRLFLSSRIIFPNFGIFTPRLIFKIFHFDYTFTLNIFLHPLIFFPIGPKLLISPNISYLLCSFSNLMCHLIPRIVLPPLLSETFSKISC